ncbi:SDR family NAD(P)-dependent oxidoreductase [Domibacillus mangrovi]|uniref:Oxidoreductase n=1 Tax=Domibacillus mangrovi TaxID=1714354 RepID=A0A1Q5P686_9BACI|nr:glucose 1-dehydrogenase [Domibacillus mangrovi]OKL37785.1 oxidoreductase [Domibacillus mangrovi]
MNSLKGKVVIVTGSSRGQGEAQVRYLSSLGMHVVIGARVLEDAKKLADEIGEDNVFPIELDVTREKDWQNAKDAVLDRFGKVDALVNNAGIYQNSPLINTSLADYQKLIQVNQIGVFLGMQTIIPIMSEQKKGSIINIVSISAFAPLDGTAAYASTKAAVVAMSKATAVEVGPKGIRVNIIHPGGIKTNMAAPDGEVPDFYSNTPLGRIGLPQEIAQVVAFLASDESSYCTGTEIVVDGGLTLGTRLD